MKKITSLILALLLMISGTAVFAESFTHPETGENVRVTDKAVYIYDGRTYNELAPNDELNGVKPDGKTDIVTAMQTVAAEITDKLTSGDIASVEIVNIPEEIKESFNALPIDQQIQVILIALGCDVDISEEDLALLQELIDALTPEILAAAFPKAKITVDGVEYEYFVIELKVVDKDANVEYERYGFRQTSEGDWVLERITVSAI